MGVGAFTLSRFHTSHAGNSIFSSNFSFSRPAKAEARTGANESTSAADEELKRLKQEIYGLILPKDQWTEPYMNPDCEICAYLMKIPCGEIYKDYMETIMRTNHNFTGSEEQFEIIQDEIALDKLHAFYECNALPETKQWWIDNQDRLDAENKQEELERHAKIRAFKKTKVQEEVRKQLELKKMELSVKPEIDILARQELKLDILKLTHIHADLDLEIADILSVDPNAAVVKQQVADDKSQAKLENTAGASVFKKAGVTPKPVAAKEVKKADVSSKKETAQRVVDPNSAGSLVLKSVSHSS